MAPVTRADLDRANESLRELELRAVKLRMAAVEERIAALEASADKSTDDIAELRRITAALELALGTAPAGQPWWKDLRNPRTENGE